MGLIYSLFLRPAVAKKSDSLRIGILGAAKIAPVACIWPLRQLEGGVCSAVAARSEEKARVFAQKQGIPRVLKNYDDLVLDPEIDAVYIPLPNGAHAEWAIKAIRAGKHVLSEKPATSNEQQALQIKEALDKYNEAHPNKKVVYAEAFHWKCHPLAQFLKSVLLGRVREWDLGDIESVDSNMVLPGTFFKEDDIRFNYDLGGGSLMDACYPLSTSRFVAHMASLRNLMRTEGVEEVDVVEFLENRSNEVLPQTIPEVVSVDVSKAGLDDRIDKKLTAILQYPSGIRSKIFSSLSGGLLEMEFSVRIVGSLGSLYVYNHVAPMVYHYVTFTSKDGAIKLTKKVYKESDNGPVQTTYWYQMRAFLEAVKRSGVGMPQTNLTGIEDAIANMRVIDAIYTKAGMPLRP